MNNMPTLLSTEGSNIKAMKHLLIIFALLLCGCSKEIPERDLQRNLQRLIRYDQISSDAFELAAIEQQANGGFIFSIYDSNGSLLRELELVGFSGGRFTRVLRDGEVIVLRGSSDIWILNVDLEIVKKFDIADIFLDVRYFSGLHLEGVALVDGKLGFMIKAHGDSERMRPPGTPDACLAVYDLEMQKLDYFPLESGTGAWGYLLTEQRNGRSNYVGTTAYINDKEYGILPSGEIERVAAEFKDSSDPSDFDVYCFNDELLLARYDITTIGFKDGNRNYPGALCVTYCPNLNGWIICTLDWGLVVVGDDGLLMNSFDVSFIESVDLRMQCDDSGLLYVYSQHYSGSRIYCIDLNSSSYSILFEQDAEALELFFDP